MALNFTTPTGRIVGGDPYRTSPVIDDKTKQPKVRKDGQTQVASYIALAFAKNDPEWPAFKAMCDGEAARLWPDGRWQHPQFASKIEDGDSTVPNKRGKRNADREGFPGHWIVKLGSGYAPSVKVWLTAAQATEQGRVAPGAMAIDGWYDSAGGEVGLGDYVKVAGTIDTNKSDDSPGMYMNYNMSALQRKGEPIVLGVDANEAFGSAPPPAAGGNAPAPTTSAPAVTAPAPAASTAPSPTAAAGSYTGYMDTAAAAPPPPAPTGPTMTAKAGNTPYSSFVAQGWTEAMLREHGYMA